MLLLVPLSLSYSLSLSLNGGSWQAHEPPDRLWGANPLALSCDAAQAYQGARGWEALDHSQKAENARSETALDHSQKAENARSETALDHSRNNPC
jgi:hypothetical protein